MTPTLIFFGKFGHLQLNESIKKRFFTIFYTDEPYFMVTNKRFVMLILLPREKKKNESEFVVFVVDSLRESLC